MQFTMQTVALQGVEALPVEVQCQFSRGPFQISIVGLPGQAIREAKERVMAAFYTHSLAIPPMRITLNLAPSDLPKTGAHYDLPIAIAILVNMEILPKEEMERALAIGELSLNGTCQAVSGVLAAAIEARGQSLRLICPQVNEEEAKLLPDLSVLAPPSLLALIKHYRGKPISSTPAKPAESTTTKMRNLTEVKGLPIARRALEISAAGRHHLFMIGPPGTGKSLLASCLPSIMPPMTAKEILDTSLVHSAAGRLKGRGPVAERPYFDPHHTASAAAIVGGGKSAGPGEISLAHNGVLFMDELPEFKRDVLESLRQPLESGQILIARANAHSSYPAKFLLVAAANPCPCGMMFDAEKWCGQAPNCGRRYMERISGPLMDRFSLRVSVPPIDAESLLNLPEGENSKTVCARVTAARIKSYERNGEGVSNEDLSSTALDEVAKSASAETRDMLHKAALDFSLSPRGYYRLLKTALTIADLEGATAINIEHVCEAVTYRLIDNEAASYDPNKALTNRFKPRLVAK